MSTRQPVLHANVPFGADAAEKPERLVVAAEQHVLSVVHALAGRRIGERRRTAAECRPRLEDEHPAPRSASAVAALRPAKPPPIDDDVGVSPAQAASGAQMRSAIDARAGRGTRIRRLKTS